MKPLRPVSPFRLLVWILPALAPALAGAAEGLEALCEKVAPAVVGIDAWTKMVPGPQDPFAFGTGVIIHPGGLVLTSITVVPDDAKNIRVYLRGGKTAGAERVKSLPEKELVLIRIVRDPRSAAGGFPFLRLGRSGGIRVGDISLALGNAFRSIADDDQISFTAGLVSGCYVLPETRSESRYIGPALETTSAVNDGMDGGPLLDAGGEVIGLLSLNFSRSRWLGTAVPMDILKPLLAAEMDWLDDGVERFPAYAGIEVYSAAVAGLSAGGIAVTRVEPRSPAARAGIQAGDRLISWDGSPLGGAGALREKIKKARPGSRPKLGIERQGAAREVEIALWGRY